MASSPFLFRHDLGLCFFFFFYVFSITQKLTLLTADTLFPALPAHISYYILDTLALPLLRAFMRSRLTGRL